MMPANRLKVISHDFVALYWMLAPCIVCIVTDFQIRCINGYLVVAMLVDKFKKPTSDYVKSTDMLFRLTFFKHTKFNAFLKSTILTSYSVALIDSAVLHFDTNIL